MELAMGGSSTNSSLNGLQTGANGTQFQQQQQQQQTQQQTGSVGGINGFGAFSGEGKGDMASVASSFSFNKTKTDESKTGGPSLSNSSGTFPFLNAQNTATTGSGFSDSMFSSLNSQPTGATTTTTSSAPSTSMSPALKPQATGFSGLKAFKPSSSFGTSLLESLPPVSMPSSSTPGSASSNSPVAATPTTSASGGLQSFGAVTSGLISQPTGMNAPFGGFGGGSSLGTGLRPQMTGGVNPFRASMFTSATGNPMNGSTGGFPSSTSSPSAFGAGNFSAGLPSNGTPFGTGTFGSGFNPNGVQDLSKQQQPQQASLI
jgi:hypothetical protein